MQKLPMLEVVPGDAFGITKKYRTQRILVQIAEKLIPICWTVIAPDGSISFSLAGNTTLTETGSASLDPSGKIYFGTKNSLSNIPIKHRQNSHVTLHPSGVCHMRSEVSPPVLEYRLDGWFPVQAGFLWIQSFTLPVGSLRAVSSIRRRDAIIPFENLESSARIEVSIFPRTQDASFPVLGGDFYTFACISPHHIVRLTIDAHAPTEHTLIIRRK